MLVRAMGLLASRDRTHTHMRIAAALCLCVCPFWTPAFSFSSESSMDRFLCIRSMMVPQVFLSACNNSAVVTVRSVNAGLKRRLDTCWSNALALSR